jgi:hypothetical protein
MTTNIGDLLWSSDGFEIYVWSPCFLKSNELHLEVDVNLFAHQPLYFDKS